MTNDITVDEQMLVSAVRYAVGRSTYITHSTAEAVRAVWGTLTANAKSVVLADLKRAISNGDLGDSMDAALWRTLYSDLLADDPKMLLRAEGVDLYRELGPQEGYPSEDEMARLRSFRGSVREYFEFVFTLWRNGAGYSVTEAERWGKPVVRIELVTGGWSGCERVISAVNQSIIGVMSADSWSRGGLYTFEVHKSTWESPEARDLGSISRGEEDGRIPDDPLPSETKEGVALRLLRDRVDFLESVIAGHDAYLTSMVSVAPDPIESDFLSASFDLHSRMKVESGGDAQVLHLA